MIWNHLLFLSCFAGFVIYIQGQSQTQNAPPTWVASSYSILTQGVSEATAVGAFLTQLKCTDPDNDVVLYSLQTGKAVYVYPNGTVTLAVKLDFEQKDTVGYDLTFICYDINSAGLRIHAAVTANLEISVNDANDNPPVFQVDNLEGYSFSVREDAPVGTVVETSIRTVDADRTVNAELKTMYLICNSTNATEKENLPETSKAMCEKFKLTYAQEKEGVYNATVTLIAPLDYAVRPVYTSKIVAIDGPNLAVRFTSTVNIQINIIDVQNLPPVFTNLGETQTVSEAAPIGSTVSGFSISARDGDTGDKRAVALSIISDPLNAFNLTIPVETTPGDGIYSSKLIIRNQLDREANPGAYMFVVKVTEIDRNTLQLTDSTATATYSVFVLDVNDNPPEFTQKLYTVNVTEIDSNFNTSSSMQITGLHIVCYDRDEPSNAKYNVTIVQQTIGVGANAKNVTDAYSITPEVPYFIGNGSMFLKVDNAAYLDYDNPDYRIHTLVLEAIEQGSDKIFSASTTISIYLQDINDNSPVFNQSAYNVSVSEASTYPLPILTVYATDKDSGLNGLVRYRLEGGVSGKFSINDVTGTISLIDKLDYETATEYVFLVYATDQSPDNRTTQVQVTVKVLNVNDVPPRFRQSQYQTSVTESSLSFLNPITVKADDEETGSNITYRIISGQTANYSFVLNSTTGDLTLKDYLDFANSPRNANGYNTGVYVLQIEASDGGQPPLTATTTVLISIIDQNNHPPVLNPTNYYKVLNETSPEGSPVVQIKGTDADFGDNGKISYRLGEGSTDNFAVNESTGWVTVGPAHFDFNVQNQYKLTIIATDGGAPQKSATAFVFVNITDNNNKDPYFSDVLYLLTVDDREAVGTVIRTITALDNDSTASLDYDILTATIVPRTPDNKQITSTSPYDYREAFGVNQTGGIYIKSKLNHNIMAEVTFSLLVRDRNTEVGDGTATTQITIIIRGEVFQNITFNLVGDVFMNEESPLGYSPLTVIAKDANNQPITNYLKVGGSDYFDVQSTGRVVLIKRIDYETDITPGHSHQIVVKAWNLQQSATATFTVIILDINDNDPQFQQNNYTAMIPETTLYPFPFLSISATDVDSNSFGPLDFTLTGLDSDDFYIFLDRVPSESHSSRKGSVMVAPNKVLDYNRRKQYDLTLIVEDNTQLKASNFRRSGFASLRIQIIDENNHSPTFKETDRRVSVSDTAEVGFSITSIIATDEDDGLNGEIQYFLQPDSDNAVSLGSQLFSVGLESGIIAVAQPLIGYGGQQFRYQVLARDRGDVPNSGSMTLMIVVISTENNDGRPKWFYPPVDYTVYVTENNQRGDFLRDPYDNATAFLNARARTGPSVSFSISSYNEDSKSFSINATSGEIRVLDSLDREKKDTYRLMIIATDTANPNLTSSLTIYVSVRDADDNNGTYTNPNAYKSCHAVDRPITFYVRENLGPNVSVANVTACDPDLPGNNAITYQLYNGSKYCAQNNNMSALRVDSNGQLITMRNIDYEQEKEFIMCIMAMPGNHTISRRKRAFDKSQMENIPNVAYVHIIVLDENDNGPRFPRNTAIGVVETVPGQGPVLTLDAKDPDGDSNNAVVYRIDSSSYYPPDDQPSSPFSGAFNLRDKGVLYPTLPSYDDYSGGRFVLSITAMDKINNSFFDKQTVTIYVYERGQPAKLILNEKPAYGIQYGESIVQQLDDISTRYKFIFLRVSEHVTQKSYDLSKTDVCFLTVDSTTANILNIRQVLDLLDQSRYQTILKTPAYHIVDEGQCVPSTSSESSIKWRNLWWVLVAVAIFIFVCCVILIILVCILYSRYKRYMETRKTYLISQ